MAQKGIKPHRILLLDFQPLFPNFVGYCSICADSVSDENAGAQDDSAKIRFPSVSLQISESYFRSSFASRPDGCRAAFKLALARSGWVQSKLFQPELLSSSNRRGKDIPSRRAAERHSSSFTSSWN